VVDNKGGTVLIWLMLRVMLDTMPELVNSVHWVVAANAAEEVIGAEFARRTEELFPAGARAVLVFEGGPKEGKQYHLVTSRKGRAEYRIRCLGKAAHAGSSHGEGVNAVVELAKVLPAAAALTDYQRQVSVNIANVHGGTVLNRVPHEAVAELEVRAFDPEVMGDVEERLLGLAGVTAQGARIEVECLGRSPGWPGGEGTEALAAVWEKAAAAVGAEIKRVGRGGLSDANYLCHLGPTLDALGPTGAHAHCSETSADGSRESEFVEIASFVPKAVINTLALRDFLNR
jgi:glutamate carboxypeptidase